MKSYDVVVVGAGDVGVSLAFKAASAGLSVCLIDKGNVGGTCLNNGCVPSKTLVHVADRIEEIREGARLGIRAEIDGVDFGAVMARMRRRVTGGRRSLRKAVEGTEEIDLLGQECRFVAPRVLEVGSEKITGKKIFIASGSRPVIPAIPGLDGIPYLTSETVLELEQRPESLILIGGGYIGLEYGHFFSALGTQVVIVERGERLLPAEEPEISTLLEKRLGERVRLLLASEVVEVKPARKGCAAIVKGRDGRTAEIAAQKVFVAAGRRSNADLLLVEKGGIAVDERGYVRVDDYLRTNRPQVWALGDAIGKAMFTHAGDKEAEIAWSNATRRKKTRMDFAAVPHAVFTSPQIASVGLTEAQARRDQEVLVGRARYTDTVMGKAMLERDGFAKAIVAKDSRRILGFHVVGPQAALLIAEVVNAVIRRERVDAITGCMHIFPALSDLITETFSNLESGGP